MTSKFKWLIGAVLAGLLVVAIAIPALAVGPTGTPNPTATPTCEDCNSTGNGQGYGGGMDEVVTKLLGMTEEQIQEQRLAGKSLVQIAADKKIGEETLINAIMADRKADLDKLVAAKTITQVQADQRLVQMKERVKLMVNRTTTGQPEWAGKGAGLGGQGRMGANGTGTPGTGTGPGGMMRFGRTAK